MFIDTEYDRAKVPPHNGNDSRTPLEVSKPDSEEEEEEEEEPEAEAERAEAEGDKDSSLRPTNPSLKTGEEEAAAKPTPFYSTPIKKVQNKGTQGVRARVRHGTSSIHFHCLPHWSSNHIGHGVDVFSSLINNVYCVPFPLSPDSKQSA